MVNRWMTGWQTALWGIALTLAVSDVARAQSEADAGAQGECTPSRKPHECAERCPSFDTCYIDDGDGQLYYRVGKQRFDCDGLECREASASLGDYCCARGQFAPSHSGGGGCSLQAERPVPATGRQVWSGLAALGAAFAGRRSVASLRRGLTSCR